MGPRHRGTGRRYLLHYAECTREHLRALTARDRSGLMDAIDERLSFEPSQETRHRKRMDENALDAGFELRVGALRVYYDVEERERVVSVLAIGRKDRSRILIGGEEVEL
jgi:mRNA-degrading endonuclease RelE of RelBE toxin-antitoxin system